MSVGFPGHPPPPPFVPVIYKAPLRDDLGQYAASLFVATRKKCGPEVSPSSFLSCMPSSMPSVFTLVLKLGPDQARTQPGLGYLWLHDNTSRKTSPSLRSRCVCFCTISILLGSLKVCTHIQDFRKWGGRGRINFFKMSFLFIMFSWVGF